MGTKVLSVLLLVLHSVNVKSTDNEKLISSTSAQQHLRIIISTVQLYSVLCVYCYSTLYSVHIDTVSSVQLQLLTTNVSLFVGVALENLPQTDTLCRCECAVLMIQGSIYLD